MIAYCYILFSRSLNRYYIGSTELVPKDRLQLHLEKHYGVGKFTAKVDDWNIFFTIQCKNISQARKIESYLKRMRNRKYLEWLAASPGAIEKIKLRVE